MLGFISRTQTIVAGLFYCLYSIFWKIFVIFPVDQCIDDAHGR